LSIIQFIAKSKRITSTWVCIYENTSSYY